MTIADLDKMEQALARRLLPWVSKASSRIIDSVKDAEAHSHKALTDGLRDERDGLRTARRFSRSPSYQAALKRLDELQAALIGPKVDSTEGLIRDARAAFYADSVALWTPFYPVEIRVVPDPVPTREGERIMRTALIHDYDLSREIGPAIEQAKRHLYAKMNQASNRGLPIATGYALVELWAMDTRDRLVKKVTQVLSDSDKAVHEATGRWLVHPDHRDELTIPTGGIQF